MSSHRRISYFLGICAVAALALTLTACGGSSPSSSSSSKPPTSSAASSPAAGATGSAATITAITTNWEAFFSAQTPISQRINLLQDGPQLQAAVQALLGSSFASQASAKVTKVTVTSPTQATVTYDILVGGTPQLKGEMGTAVLENGTWKVGVSTFCSLATLFNGGKTSGLPAPCQTS
jgi:hypothetical protein